jgi:major intracellular serine protease
MLPEYTIQELPQPKGIPWNIQMVNAPSFWAKTKGGGRVVAVIDTGCDQHHQEFDGGARIINPRNFTAVGNLYDVTDKQGHGTHVAGTIAGKTVGVAPEVRIMPLKVFCDDSNRQTGFEFQDAFAEVLRWNRECDVRDRVVAVNCSFGSQMPDAMMAYYIRRLVSDGVVVCVAAGNSGDGNADTHEVFSYPAFLEEVVTVSSVAQDGNIANYSNSFDGIDLAAPGTLIYSCWPGGTYKTISGTSMATPHVTGAVALIADMFYQREGRYPAEGEIDNACPFFPQVEGILFKHIKKAGDSYLYGRGILDLTYETKRWPLYRVQSGAFYNESGADVTKVKVEQAGSPAYKVKY